MEGLGTRTLPFITDRYHPITATLTTPTSSLGECTDPSFFVTNSVSFLSKLIRTGGKRPLTVEDLGAVGKDDKASTLYDAYSKEWAKEQEKKKQGKNPSFIKAMVRATGLCYWVTGVILILVGCLLGFVPTILLNLLVSDFESDEPSAFLLLSSPHRLQDALGVRRPVAGGSIDHHLRQLHRADDDDQDRHLPQVHGLRSHLP